MLKKERITILKKAGIIILIVGLLMTLYTGFTYFTREKVANLGEREITKDDQNTVNWQPYVGIGIMIIGGVVLVLGVNRKDEKEINDDLK
jgi:drug/metabolite transporter (DMT)-like permease